MKSEISNNDHFTSEQIKHMSNLRIIQTNLIHVHGFPKSIAQTKILQSNEYFGQYGTIVKAMITYKINPDNKKKLYSAYISYSNEREAALAILCADSLLIDGRIIRVFFGTNKYCRYFLNKQKCPNINRCWFLHRLATNKDIIIDDNTNFPYNEHINLSKKILELSNLKKIELTKIMTNPKMNKLPSADFIFLNEEEKSNYFTSGNIRYIRSNSNSNNNINIIFNNNISINNFFKEDNCFSKNISYDYEYNNSSLNKNHSRLLDLNIVNNKINKSISIPEKNPKNNPIEPIDLHRIFINSINHILSTEPFFSKLKNFPLKKMELDFFQKDLAKNNVDIKVLLDGCLDCL
jgi:hypothetical protein